jgi:uncharacterized membrane protein
LGRRGTKRLPGRNPGFFKIMEKGKKVTRMVMMMMIDSIKVFIILLLVVVVLSIDHHLEPHIDQKEELEESHIDQMERVQLGIHLVEERRKRCWELPGTCSG